MIGFLVCLILAVFSYAQDAPEVTEITGKNSLFKRPSALAVGLDNSLYVVDTGNSRIVALNDSGHLLYESSQGGSIGELRWPIDVAISGNGKVYVADAGNKRIVEYSRLLEWRGEFVVRNSLGEVLEPRLVASNIEGDLFIYEYSDNQLIKYDRFFSAVGRFSGQVGGILSTPISLACIGDDLYWIDDATRAAYTCDKNLSNARPLQSELINDNLYQLTGNGQALFAVTEREIVRINKGTVSAVTLEAIEFTERSARDLRIAAGSDSDLFVLDSRSGRILLIRWP